MSQTWPDEFMKIIKCNEQSKILFCRVTKWATDSKPATDDNGEDVTWSYVRRISWANVEKAAVSLVILVSWHCSGRTDTIKNYRSEDIQYQETSIMENSNFGTSVNALFFNVKLLCLRH
jgi:hypothetical protein